MRLKLACALGAAAVLGVYSVASAHVTLVSSDPAAGSRLAGSPTRFRLEFSEPVEASVARLSITGSNGKAVSLPVAGDPRNAYVLLSPGRELGLGTFRVSWHVVSADGHPVNGSFVFTVGDAVGAAPAGAAPPAEPEALSTWGPTVAGAPAVPALLRGLGVGALAALAGLLFFHVTTAARSDGTVARMALQLAIAAPVLLAGHLVAWLLNASPDHRLSSEWLSSAFGSTVGRAELWRTLLALPPLWAIALARRPRLALALTVPGLLMSAAVGHSAAFYPAWSIPLKAFHLLAIAAWLGGLLWLVAGGKNDTRRFVDDTVRVSSFALMGVIAIGITGVVQGVLLVPSFGNLASSYGVVLLLKVAGLGVLLGFGAYHRFRVLPRLVTGGGSSAVAAFGKSLRREVAVLWLVAVIGGVLAYVSPPVAGGAHQNTISESDQ